MERFYAEGFSFLFDNTSCVVLVFTSLPFNFCCGCDFIWFRLFNFCCGHFKKECTNYLKSKGKVYATTLSELDSSNSDSEESCDEKGNYSAFMTIAHVESSDELNLLVQKLGEHSDEESLGGVEESNAEDRKSTRLNSSHRR